MRRATNRWALVCLAAGLVAGCGASTQKRTTTTTTPPPPRSGAGERLYNGVRGGSLVAYVHSDLGSLDPAQVYSTVAGEVTMATQRTLYSYLPNQTRVLSPDLASGPAIVSSDGRTVTVHIRHGVYFSPPVNREVTSADVAYAIERGTNPNVITPYFPAYFDDIVGASKAAGGPIPGIVTPNQYTIVFHLTGPYGGFFKSALSLPVTAPVPRSFAAPLDAKKPSAYGSNYQVATGPYMVKANAQGKILNIGYVPDQSATLVRNPNWNSATDFRPAYLNQIDIKIGGDPNVIGREVLEGSDAVQNDQVSASVALLAYQHYYNQLVVVPGAGVYYIALDNKRGPFANQDVRKALWAALDREGMLRVSGGPLAGQLGTHFIYPGSVGYQLAGGAAGPAVNYNLHPAGNVALAASYMKAAGYPSGKYTGPATIHVIGASGDPYAAPAQIVDQTLVDLGFKTDFLLLDQSAMFTKCGTPAQEIDVCPSAGWTRDFDDPQTILDPIFAGYNIIPSGDPNLGQVNSPQVNAAMRVGERLVDPTLRARAWANIDRMLVGIAAAIPWSFIANPTIESSDVRGVNNLTNAGFWDYSFTSLR